MVVVTNNWRIWAVGMAASLVLFLVVYFVAIRPSENTANQAVKTGLAQTQQALNQAGKQLNSSTAGSSSANQAAQSTLSNAQKLTQCVQAAGTNASALATCQSKYQP